MDTLLAVVEDTPVVGVVLCFEEEDNYCQEVVHYDNEADLVEFVKPLSVRNIIKHI